MSEPVNESHGRAQERRERLRDLMDRLEHALAEPAQRDLTAWRDALRAISDEMADALDEHITETEGADGFFVELVRTAPRLHHRVERLRREHPELVSTHEEFRAVLDDDGADDPAADARACGLALISALVRHRHLGADLLYEAYWVDVSSGD